MGSVQQARRFRKRALSLSRAGNRWRVFYYCSSGFVPVRRHCPGIWGLAYLLVGRVGAWRLARTIKAAPFMMSLRRIDDNASALQKAFNGFRRWGNVRGILQILAFLANVWALLAVLGAFRET